MWIFDAYGLALEPISLNEEKERCDNDFTKDIRCLFHIKKLPEFSVS